MPETQAPMLPGDSDRITVVGRTGTGKTVAGLWHLSNQNLEKPWIICNIKRDEHIESIANTEQVDLNYVPGKKDKGIFVADISPYDFEASGSKDKSPFDKMLLNVWHRGDCGLFFDELVPVGNSRALTLCYTQGRSLHIPIIGCSQRPVGINRYAFTEAGFVQVFDLNIQDDIDTVESFVPLDWDEEQSLGPHESFYYVVSTASIYRFKPVPSMDEIRKKFERKMPRRFQWI
jgi:hypothetical protein